MNEILSEKRNQGIVNEHGSVTAVKPTVMAVPAERNREGVKRQPALHGTGKRRLDVKSKKPRGKARVGDISMVLPKNRLSG
jgi:hypothetical protein